VSYIVHVVTDADRESLRSTGEYRPASLEEEGFVHCSKPGQVVVAGDRFYAGRDDLSLLVLDEDRIAAPVRYETDERTGSDFPHVYGPVELAAVVAVVPFRRDETGFRLPVELFDL
jgi:uncharacterized protein (DUF952 family)